jgi:BirA family transcriptional regulator, biotin operon repressor / biotin---[acetyl-CoA-carboxylase] ligase
MSSSIFRFDQVPTVLIFDTLDSTSKELLRMIDNGYAEQGDIVFAKMQTDGYGRDGRRWESQLGNLFVSFLLEPRQLLERLSFVSFLLAKNVIEALEEVIGAKAKIGYKWPNDVMLNGKKIGGILLQTKLDSKSLCRYMVCGFGLNLKQHPSNIVSTDVLHELSLMLDQNKLAYDILARFESEYASYLSAKHKTTMTEVIAFLKGRTDLLGQEITVSSGMEKKSGVCQDIDANGNLLLQAGGRVEQILSGDIINVIA